MEDAYNAAREEARQIMIARDAKKKELADKGMAEALILRDPEVANLQQALDAKNQEVNNKN